MVFAPASVIDTNLSKESKAMKLKRIITLVFAVIMVASVFALPAAAYAGGDTSVSPCLVTMPCPRCGGTARTVYTDTPVGPLVQCPYHNHEVQKYERKATTSCPCGYVDVQYSTIYGCMR